MGALDVKLTAEEVADMRAIAEEAENVPGDRYAKSSMDGLFIDSPELPTA